MSWSYHYRVLPGVERKIERTLARLGLHPSNPAESVAKWIRERRRFYMPVMVDAAGTRFFFKGRLQLTTEVLKSIRREIAFHRTLQTMAPRYRRAFLIPQYRAHGEDGSDYVWYVREFDQGTFAGIQDIDIGHTGTFLTRCGPAQFARAIETLQRLSPILIRQLRINRHGSHWYGVDFSFYESRATLQRRHPRELVASRGILEEGMPLLERSARVVSHGDLYPNNILLREDDRLVLFDWELINQNNAAFDVGFTYLLAWRRPAWQRAFLRHCKPIAQQTDAFPQLFRLVMISLTWRFIRHCVIAQTRGYGREQQADHGISAHAARVIPRAAKHAHQFYLRTLRTALAEPERLLPW